MKYIRTDKAPPAIGPYAQAIQEGSLVYCSGQIGIDPVSGQLQEGIENQTKQVLTNLEAVLHKAETDLQNVLKTTIYLTSIADFAKVNDIYASFFNGHTPARVTVGVTTLPKGALIEIDATAVVK